MSIKDELINHKEFQDTMGIKKNTYYRWINEESLPVYKVGRKIYHKESEVINWFSTKKVKDELSTTHLQPS